MDEQRESTAKAQGDEVAPGRVPETALLGLDEDIEAVGGPWQEAEEHAGAVGRTTFDVPSSEDNLVTVVLAKEHVALGTIGSQSIVRIKSGLPVSRRARAAAAGVQAGPAARRRDYIGVVVSGPFAEPDGLRGDAPVIITTAARGGVLTPPYHGRLEVEIMGEEVDGGMVPPRFRPLPNSPVFLLNEEETARVMKLSGELRLGLVTGYSNIALSVPAADKSVLPRHTGILGTTGGGKSTTVARLVAEAQAQNYAVVLIDVEGEYTSLNEATSDPRMHAALAERGLRPGGVPNTTVYHLVGRDTANPQHPDNREFSLQFARLSPYTVKEILELSEAQDTRFDVAYDLTRRLMAEFGIFPRKGDSVQEAEALEYDEFERGYPRLTLSYLLDIIRAFVHRVSGLPGDPELYNGVFRDNIKTVMERIAKTQPASSVSWRALAAKLWKLHRIEVFDQFNYANPERSRALPLKYKEMLRPGHVSILDLSDTDSSTLNNLVIADLLMGVQDEQDRLYNEALQHGAEMPRVLVIIEEAHEFLSSERIEKMPVLFEQVARIAKRGRKRWLGLVFVTQLPQHLPSQVFGLINNYIIHKITDSQVISRLQRSVPGIDESQWRRVAALAPGQAIASFTHMARPLLVSIDPTPARLRMVD